MIELKTPSMPIVDVSPGYNATEDQLWRDIEAAGRVAKDETADAMIRELCFVHAYKKFPRHTGEAYAAEFIEITSRRLIEDARRQGYRVLDDAKSGWRSMEAAPKDGTPVLLAGGHDDSATPDPRLSALFAAPCRAAWIEGEGWLVTLAEAGDVAVTYNDPRYWMPLPTPPKQGERR